MFVMCVCLVVSRATKEPAVNLPDPTHVPMPDLSSQPLDPDEPTYCHCQQVSFGEMIGCDNDDVRLLKQWSCVVFLGASYMYVHTCGLNLPVYQVEMLSFAQLAELAG